MIYASVEKPKKKHRRGLWSPDEDQRLKDYVLKHGHGCWSSVPINAGLQRNGKSCRLRWINYLRPGLKHGAFTVAEQETVLALHNILGNKWSQIAHHLPGRSDNEIKNYWHSYLKKRVAKMAETDYKDENLKPSSQSEADQKLSLPKVIFAEWLTFDESYGQYCFNADSHSSDLGDSSMDGLLINHGTVGIEDWEIPVDFSPAELNNICDDIYTF